MRTTRRNVLKVGLSGLAAAGLAPALRGDGRSSRPRALIVIELAGGNDSLNTIIPCTDAEYRRARPTLAIGDGLPLDERFALHPSLRRLKSFFDRGQVAIVQGCGYPRISRSHYRSSEVWQAAIPGEHDNSGWLGRYLEATGGARGIALSTELPRSLHGRGGVPKGTCRDVPVPDPAPIGCNSGRGTPCSAVDTPPPFACVMDTAARILTRDPGVRIIHAPLPGFDTHTNQLEGHAAALAHLDEGLATFWDHLELNDLSHDAMVMIHSEFARRVQENGVGGTDHGGAGAVILVGPALRGGFYGLFPSLADLSDGDQKYTTDFRRVYATLLERWLDTNSTSILGASFVPLEFM